jgi:hypothetical protein
MSLEKVELSQEDKDSELSRLKNNMPTDVMPDIDFSKISNVKGLEKTDPEAKKLIKGKKKEKKFSFLSPFDVPLASGGRYYADFTDDKDVLNGVIKMIPMSMAEEEILGDNVSLKEGSGFRKVFDAVIQSEINAEDILLYDETIMMYCMRNFTYGNLYTFKLTCPECGQEFETEVKISDLVFPEVPIEITDPMVLELPISKYTLVQSLPRMRHTEELRRLMKQKPDEAPRVLDFVVRTINIIDDKKKPVSPRDWIDFYNQMPAGDRSEITKKFDFPKGVDQITVTCQNRRCGHEYKIDIPFGVDFFQM